MKRKNYEHVLFSCPQRPKRTLFKRPGTVWRCPNRDCGQWWIVRESAAFCDIVKVWEKL